MKSGVDVVKIERIKNSKNIDLFLSKYFCQTEQQYVTQKSKAAETIAGIFACKEAVLKALGVGIGGGIDLCQVEICHDANGKPFVNINANILLALSKLNCTGIDVSISHDGDYAVAFCIIF